MNINENQNKQIISIIPINDLPEIKPNDNLGQLIIEKSDFNEVKIINGDILVITQKLVSKSENRTKKLSEVIASPEAQSLSIKINKDPKLIELILRESSRIVAMDTKRGLIITETKHGFICANSGIDSSNILGDDEVSLLPINPDLSAKKIRETIVCQTHLTKLGIIITDTFGRAWRNGQTNVCIGLAGLHPIKDYRGFTDDHGSILTSTEIAIADEIASAAELVMGKTNRVGAAILRGYRFDATQTGKSENLIRDSKQDLFNQGNFL